MLSFGILMGFVFPVYARFFVEWKPGMLGYFVAGCIAAGITVGVVSFLFVKVIEAAFQTDSGGNIIEVNLNEIDINQKQPSWFESCLEWF